MRLSVLILILVFPLFLKAQPLFSPAPAVNGITILNRDGEPLEYAFAGGLNNCQYGQIDLNLDGIKDLVVFDRHGNRLLCFVNRGIADSISWEYTPQYSALFPQLKEWMILKDYNNDGKDDIFTYTTGGIKVFRNISENSLEFRQVSFPYLVSLQGSTLTNILVTYADYPAVEDVDEDGDIDILTFKGLGSFIEWHKNKSMELFGNADSLVFERVSNCWGRFAEAGESNIIQLDTCYEPKDTISLKNDPKHTGSTLLLNDFSGNNLKDIVIGDVDFMTLILLTNGGSLSEAEMISQTTDFPDTVNPVYFPSFPVACLADVNNDQQKDLLVSGFDPGLLKSQNLNSSWLYLVSDDNSFQFRTTGFLQNQMLDLGSGAYPVFFDYNSDGKTDLVIGNYGKLDTCTYSFQTGLQCFYHSSLALLENVGDMYQPAFKLIDDDYLGLSALEMQSLIPAFGDLDGDGDADLLCGNSKGKFIFLENLASPSQAANFQLVDPAYHQLDVGEFSAPQVFDLDADGLNDIISGKRDGRISYYRNNGPVDNPSFQLITDSLGGVDVTDPNLSYYGYSVPHIYQQNDQELYLLVGSEFGEVYVFDNLRQNLEGSFHPLGMLNIPVQGWRSATAMTLLDADTLPDILIGNFCGGLGYFEGFTTALGEIEPLQLKPYLNISPNPAGQTIRINLKNSLYKGLVELKLITMDGRENIQISELELPFDLDISNLPTGFYLVQITGQGFNVSAKLIVQR